MDLPLTTMSLYDLALAMNFESISKTLQLDPCLSLVSYSLLSCHVGIFYHHNYLGSKSLMKTSIKLVVVHDGKLQLHKTELVAVTNARCSMKSKLTLCHLACFTHFTSFTAQGDIPNTLCLKGEVHDRNNTHTHTQSNSYFYENVT